MPAYCSTSRAPLSTLFRDPMLRAAFAAAERDQDPEEFAVPATSPTPPRTDGATAERELCVA